MFAYIICCPDYSGSSKYQQYVESYWQALYVVYSFSSVAASEASSLLITD